MNTLHQIDIVGIFIVCYFVLVYIGALAFAKLQLWHQYKLYESRKILHVAPLTDDGATPVQYFRGSSLPWCKPLTDWWRRRKAARQWRQFKRDLLRTRDTT